MRANFFDSADEAFSFNVVHISIVTRNNIVWKLARGYCLCYYKTFSLVPNSTGCTKSIFIEECSTLSVLLKIK